MPTNSILLNVGDLMWIRDASASQTSTHSLYPAWMGTPQDAEAEMPEVVEEDPGSAVWKWQEDAAIMHKLQYWSG